MALVDRAIATISQMAEATTLPVGLDEGSGHVLVLIPGYGTRPDTYEPLVRLLAQRCRVILLDIFAVRGAWRFDEVLRSFTTTLDLLGLDRASFLGRRRISRDRGSGIPDS